MNKMVVTYSSPIGKKMSICADCAALMRAKDDLLLCDECLAVRLGRLSARRDGGQSHPEGRTE